MERRVYEASLNGNEQALQELIQQDQLILERACVVVSCHETPLHVAASRGHLNMVKAILSLNPKLAKEQDASGCSPLHLASSGGYLCIVRELLPVSSGVYNARDKFGRTALHVAVVRGHVEVVGELVGANPEWVRQRMEGGESVFQLCIKYGRVEALKKLVEMGKDEELIASADDDGNTVLHFAAIFKQLEAVKYLVSVAKVKAIANTINNNGHTALDVSEKCAKDFQMLEIQQTLIGASIGRAKDLNKNLPIISPTNPKPSRFKKLARKCFKYLTNHFSDSSANDFGNLMVVATVIATMCFQGGVAPPGGVWPQDTVDGIYCSAQNVCKAGTAVLAYSNPKLLRYFYARNTVAFIASLCVILLHFSGFPLKNKVGTWFVTLAMCITLNTVLAAYILASTLVLPAAAIAPALDYVQWAWTILLLFGLLLHTIRLAHWLMFRVLTTYLKPSNIFRRRTWTKALASTIFAAGVTVLILLFTIRLYNVLV